MTTLTASTAYRRPPAPRGERRSASAPKPPGLHPLLQVKLWQNPCWFSFRINYVALKFNVPVYDWIEERYELMRPEYVVLYSLGLRDGIAAKDVVASSGFPKNTISRAVQKLLALGIIRRTASRADRRSYVLTVTARGRRILDETLPPMLAHEQAMLAGLSAAEQRRLGQLLAKLVVDSPRWPTQIPMEDMA